MRQALVLFTILLMSTTGFAQQGIGVRLGDPSGLTYKRYNGDNALEFSIGRSHTFVGKNYYNHKFDKWYSDARFGYKDYVPEGVKHSVPIGMHVHYLMHTDWFASEFDGLQWYYGFGIQLRHQTLTYSYRYKLEGESFWRYDGEEKVTDLDIGLDGVIGAEYEFENVPIRVFVDLTLFIEIVDDPFIFHFPMGIGGRYMF